MLCLVGLQNVKLKKKVKVQLRGPKCNWRVQKTHMLVPIIRLKLTRDEDAAFAYLFVQGFKTKLPIFDPGVKFKILPKSSGSLRDHKCSENKFAATKIKLTFW